MAIKMIAIDIDETLLNSAQELTDPTVAAIEKASALGIKIVLCSGRPLAGLTPYLNRLGISGDDQYVVTYNGAIVQSVSGNVIAKHLLKPEDYSIVQEFCDENEVHFNALDNQSNIYTSNLKVGWYTVRQAAENEAGLTVLEDSDLPIRFPLTKMMLADQPEVLDRIADKFIKKFDQDYYIVRSRPFFLEASNIDANKGSGLRDLMSYLKMDASEVMGIGDEANDLPMFEAAGTAVAMGNARDVIQKQANWVTADNNHDGVAKAIQEFVI